MAARPARRGAGSTRRRSFLEELVGDVARSLFAGNVRLQPRNLLLEQRDALLSSLTDSSARSWPISCTIFFFGRSSSSIAGIARLRTKARQKYPLCAADCHIAALAK